MTRRRIEVNRDKLIQLLIAQHASSGAAIFSLLDKIEEIIVSHGLMLEREQVLGVYTIRYHNMMAHGEKRTIGYEPLLANLKESDQDEFLLVMANIGPVGILVFANENIDTLFGILRAREDI